MRNIKFFSVGEEGDNWRGTTTWLLENYGFESVSTPELADIIVFNGGADIGTEIYGEKPVFTGIPEFKSHRDKHEIEIFEKFKDKKFFFGICRGAQLLNCLSGGTLWQHVNNHQQDHQMIDLRTEDKIMITSTHHQMMRPDFNNPTMELIGVAARSTNKQAGGGTEWSGSPNKTDVEVVWYGDTKCLCIQGHPEYVPFSDFADWSINLLLEKYGAE